MTILTCKFRIMNSKIELMLRNEVLNLKFSQIIENYMFLSLIKNFPGIPGKQLYFPGLENTPGSRFPGIPGSRERNPSLIVILPMKCVHAT